MKTRKIMNLCLFEEGGDGSQTSSGNVILDRSRPQNRYGIRNLSR
ncbi:MULTISPECIES: hypothetical protein [Blautia]|nr:MULTISPECIES: hypothetical protein [Blautia]MCQ4740165.1 hypothetical protein [Blautia hominis]MCQ5095183.1 hypothetical protein [Blautia producta]MDY4056736.1 hypothetical protein [Blautia sp.]